MYALITTKTIVNFKLQTGLLAVSIVLHLVAAAVYPSYPLLGWLLAVLETVGWLSILIIWSLALIHGLSRSGPQLWTRVWTFARTQLQRSTTQEQDLLVPVEQLKAFRENIGRLRLALHQLTPEMEQARHTQFQMLGEAVPDPVVPPQNVVLYAEFTSLIRFLNHFGFPHLERVRIGRKEFAFAEQWRRDLEIRLLQAQKQHAYQQQAMEWLLSEAGRKLEALSSTNPQVQDNAGYQRIYGAFKLLKTMARASHRPEEVASSLTALMQDMERLQQQVKQA